MAISFQPSNKVELRVEAGKTNLEALQKFQQDAEARGGGQIRAKKNDDGSFTLYVAADKKVRLRGVFGQSYGKEARDGKIALAKDLMKEIISRRLPEGSGGQNRELLARLDERSSSHVLGKVLDDVVKNEYGHIDVIMTTPGLKEAFGASLKEQFVGENFTFLSLVQQYENTSNPHEKMQLAEQIYKMVESPENPPSREVPVQHSDKPVQINISSEMGGRITESMHELRELIVPGKKPSLTESDKQRLNNLFSEAKAELREVTKAALTKFIKSDAFKTEAGKAHTARLQQQSANPAGILKPGSGEAFNKQVKQFGDISKLMGDPEVRAAYKEHVAGTPHEAHFDRYEMVEQLVTFAKRGDVSDAELLQHCENLLVPEEQQAEDRFPEMVSGKIQQLRDERALLGGGTESRQLQDEMFGQERLGQDNLVRGKILSFLNEMQADAANGLGGDRQKSFLEGDALGKIVAKRLFNEDLDWRPESESHVGSMERFAGKELVGSGGATGSGRAKVGDQYFQVKGSISHAGLGRRLKAGGLNTENYGEVISSNIARSLLPKQDRGQVPEVALRQDGVNHEAVVTSKYLAGGKGDLKGLYTELCGPLPKGQKHPKIQLDAPEGAQSGGGVLRLSGQASRDVQRNLALSALLGDHDVNPGNMIALQDGHVGRIDFGHAFNELISAPGGKLTGGGGVHNKSNRVLDFFNRESVSGNPFVSGSTRPKVWRDYIGPGPSEGMTQALRDIAGSQTAMEGIVQAKTQFTDLIARLETENTPEARKQIQDLTQSLARIATNIEKPITATEPGEIVKQVFNNIEAFVKEGQAQMREVADLSELQTKIDAFVNSTRENPGAPIPEDIQQAYARLTGSSVKLEDGSGLNWMKQSAGTPAFQGNLTDFIQTRRAEIVGE